MYLPLAPLGLARTTASTSAPRFCRILLLGEADLADRHVDHAGLVDAELDAAALDLA